MITLHLNKEIFAVTPPETRARDEEDPRDIAPGMPWWVRAIAIIGIPGVLAIYLVYVGAQELPSIRRAAEQTEREVVANREVIRGLITQTDALQRTVQRICYNTAKTDAERDRCFD